MQVLADFILALSYPPNPVRPLDNDYTNRAGADIFFSEKTMADVADKTKIINRGPIIFRCVDCHTVDRKNRQFGTSKKMYSAPALTSQDAKIPHLRFLYDRIGYFDNRYSKDNEDIHAAGFNHGGAFNDGMFFGTFIWIIADDRAPYTTLGGSVTRYTEMFDFLMGFDTNVYPMYGRQMTLNPTQWQHDETMKNIDHYVKNAYFPLNTAQSQCIIRSRGVNKDGTVDFDQIRKKDIANKNGDFLPEKLSRMVAAWADKNYLSMALTCE